MTIFRVGHGYDIHRLIEGRRLVLAGENIQFEKGLDGHSDADVVVHAVMDSLLGAAGLPDIGVHFPDTDPEYKNADSLELLKKVVFLIKEKGYAIGNIDITVVLELPRLSPYINNMKKNVSTALGIDIDDISIKAATNEKMGPVGRGEGIAAFSVALLYK